MQVQKETDKKAKDDVDIAKFVKGKSVVFVGPAPYLMGKGWGKKIDQYDIVVRTGGSPPVPKDRQKDYGSKTDIWYVNTSFLHMYDDDRLEEVKRSGCKFVNIRHAMGREYVIFEAGMRSRIYNAYLKEVKMPTMGVALMNEILQWDPKELRVLGVTFFCDGFEGAHLSGYLSQNQLRRHENLIVEEKKGKQFVGMNHDYHKGDLWVKKQVDAGKVVLDEETLGFLEKALVVNKHLDRVRNR